MLNSHYSPFGVILEGRNFEGEIGGTPVSAYRYGYQGSERDDEVKGAGNSYTTHFRQLDPRLGRWLTIDPRAKDFANQSPYCSMDNNPVYYTDVVGDSTWVYTTTLPNAYVSGGATHSFIVTKTEDGKLHYYAYGPKNDSGWGTDQLVRKNYKQDKEVYTGKDEWHLKEKIPVKVPEGMTQEEFDQEVIEAAESFGNNPDIKYHVLSMTDVTGNCHTSTTTILHKAGVSKEELDNIEWQIPGFNWGFEDVKPWTDEEQKEAVRKHEEWKKKYDEAKKDWETMKQRTAPVGPKL